VVIVAAWSAAAGAEEAKDDLVAAVPDDCGCVAQPAPHVLRSERDRREVMALGWSFIAVGQGLATLHAVAGEHGRLTDLIPIGGPISAIANERDAPGWTATLLFSAWSQAVGALVLVLIGASPDEDPGPPLGRSGPAPVTSAALRF
jgi:hypothetical protein